MTVVENSGCSEPSSSKNFLTHSEDLQVNFGISLITRKTYLFKLLGDYKLISY